MKSARRVGARTAWRRALVALAVIGGALLGMVGAARAQGAEPGAAPSRGALHAEAQERFREGVALLKDDPAQARARLMESVARFRAMIESGIDNGPLRYNIGNAYLLAGDVGRAIASYRRAEEFMPGDANLANNLAVARARTLDRIPVETKRRALRTLLFWHYDLSAGAKWRVFVIAFVVVWAVALARLIGARRAAPRWVIGAGVVIAAAMAASLGAGEFGARARQGVITAAEVVGRKGPDGAAYEPSFAGPLHAGVEFDAAETRGEWVLARLSDGRETWLPSSSVEMID